MSIKSSIIKYSVLGILFTSFISCKKYLDINTDPNNPTTIDVSKLLPTAERGVGDGLSMGSGTGGLSEVLAVYMHQMSTREQPDQYGATASNFFIENAWPTLYLNSLSNLEQIVIDATEKGNRNYAGIAKVLKAYIVSQLVDVFGDVPYSEIIKLKEGNRYPKFDDDATIYPQLFSLLDEAIDDLKSDENVVTPGTDDVIYDGDTDKWVKAANTLKLKMYVQVRKVQDVTSEVTALLANDDELIGTTDESFVIPYGPVGSTDDRNPAFGDYIASQRANHVSPWFYEILKGYNLNILTSNPDPRLPYYIFNQLGKTETPAGQTEYRDSAFVSIYFGSGGPDRDRNQQTSISLFGIYPVGGRYDDGVPQVGSTASGTGAAPYRLITYADRLYLEAELIKAEIIDGDAKAKLKEAIEESFAQVDWVVTEHVKPSQTVPKLEGAASVQTYITKALAEYDAKPAKQLEIIMTQKWLSSVGSHVDQYTDYRRTGFPILFDPNNTTMAPGGFVQPPINGDPVGNPGAQPAVPVTLSRVFPLSLLWPQTELEANPNAPSQKTAATYKVFWMP
ncbi:MAG: SusD/RagB family nutrient-binding outer membrane lipoprotein [Chitinophagaceae bacterium]|nr:SusD/RagB family nutrient-binding outer membrane lipoprotein [Chitinophagaceae bacterium]